MSERGRKAKGADVATAEDLEYLAHWVRTMSEDPEEKARLAPGLAFLDNELLGRAARAVQAQSKTLGRGRKIPLGKIKAHLRSLGSSPGGQAAVSNSEAPR